MSFNYSKNVEKVTNELSVNDVVRICNFLEDKISGAITFELKLTLTDGLQIASSPKTLKRDVKQYAESGNEVVSYRIQIMKIQPTGTRSVTFDNLRYNSGGNRLSFFVYVANGNQSAVDWAKAMVVKTEQFMTTFADRDKTVTLTQIPESKKSRVDKPEPVKPTEGSLAYDRLTAVGTIILVILAIVALVKQ